MYWGLKVLRGQGSTESWVAPPPPAPPPPNTHTFACTCYSHTFACTCYSRLLHVFISGLLSQKSGS